MCRSGILLFTILFLFLCPNHVHSEDSVEVYKKLSQDPTLSLQSRVNAANRGIIWAQKTKDTYSYFLFSTIKGRNLLSMGEYSAANEWMSQVVKKANSNLSKRQDSLYLNLYHSIITCVGLCKIYIGEHEEAIGLFNHLLSLYENDTNAIIVAQCYAGTATLFAKEGKLDIAVQYFNKSLEIFKYHKDMEKLYITYCNLGGCYSRSQNYNNALECFFNAYNCLIATNYEGDQIAYINFWLGSAYNGLNQKALAEKYFQEALQLANKYEMSHLISYICLHYSNMLISEKRFNDAKKIAKQALAKMQNGENKRITISLLNNLSDISIYQNNYQEGYKYLLQSFMLLDSQKKLEGQKRLDILQNKFENYKKEQEEIITKKDMELAKNKIVQRNLWILFFIMLTLFSCLLSIWLFLRILKQCKINNLMKSRLDQVLKTSQVRVADVKEMLIQEIDTKNKELTSKTLHITKVNNLAFHINQKLKYLRVQSTFKAKEKDLISEIEQLASELVSDNNLQEFDLYFQQVKSDFFEKLDTRFPFLTPNEKRLCALLSLMLSSKEIADLTKRTLESVGMAKTRLRKKMKLRKGEDLDQILSNL